TYKSKDCEWSGQAPVCLPCPNGTFTAVDNIMEKCFQCTRCRTELQQIEKTPCTLKQDTVCGCRKNQYQFGEADFFECKNCSPCANGIITNYGNLVLGIILAIFVVICVVYIVNKAVKLVQKNGIASSFYSCVSLPQTSKEPVSEVSKMMIVRVSLPLSTMLTWDPE
ncbi:hypothetical protein CIB84_014460, partial [Bambusicola thoracicus]